jgi:hypothetical protein
MSSCKVSCLLFNIFMNNKHVLRGQYETAHRTHSRNFHKPRRRLLLPSTSVTAFHSINDNNISAIVTWVLILMICAVAREITQVPRRDIWQRWEHRLLEHQLKPGPKTLGTHYG